MHAGDKKAAPSIAEDLAALAPLTEELSRSVTCPICLEHMVEARQLQCGHLFCAECVVRILGMKRVRCAICKEKTGKRMIRQAPLPFTDIVRELHVLEKIVAQCVPPKRQNNASLNDGFKAVLQTTLARIGGSAVASGSDGGRKVAEDATVEHVTPSKSECALCPRVAAEELEAEIEFGHLVATVAKGRRHEVMVHEQCGLYSLDVYQVEGRFDNVQLLLSRSSNWVCSRKGCGQTRANVVCTHAECSMRYHYCCAVLDGCVFVEDGYKVFCPAHKEHAPKIGDREFDKNLDDPNGAFSRQHSDACYKCGIGGRLLMCDTCERVTHPVCSGLKGIPLGDWSCAVCTGVEVAVVPSAVAASAQADVDSKTKLGRRASGGCKRRRPDVATLANGAAGSKRTRKSLDGGKRYTLCHTGLSETQRELLKGVAKVRKTSIRQDVDTRVTHMVISAYSGSETPSRTMKLCKAIAAKKRIVCWKWIEESAEQKGWTSFEEHLHPLTWAQDAASVFHDMRFYFGAYNGARDKKDDLITLVRLGGGTVVERDASSYLARNPGQLLFVRDEDSKKNGRRESSARHEPPPGATLVPSLWILDQCTKSRCNT